MFKKALKCLQPIPNFTHPNPIQHHPPINPQHTPHTNLDTKIISWNCGTLNTALPRLQALTNKPTPPSIIAIQETKLTTSKSTKYLQRLFPQYKMIFNNTATPTQIHQTQRQPYNNPRGGLLTLIHQHYAFPVNVTKIPTTINISPYLQIIKITNHPFSTYLILHMYMPTHTDDITLIPTIQTTIFNQIHNNPQCNIILVGDFNRDIALIGKQHGTTITNPTQQDLDWKQFTILLHLQYIPTNTNYSYQGGNNYTSTSLIDEFYTKIQQTTINTTPFTSKTILNLKQNSNHYPICLNIPPNNIISKKHIPTPNTKPKLLNPIPPENINMFRIKFSETNTNHIQQLTNLLQNNITLTQNQWQHVCDKMDQMICSISKIVEDTCIAPSIPTLTNLTSKQGGYLPKKLQKSWKKELSTYHTIRKAIKITTQDTNWRTHLIITNLQNHLYTTIPNPPHNPTLISEWIRTLGNKGKKAKKEARDIIAKQTTINCKKAISKYINTLNLQPRRIHKVIFKNIENTTLDSIKDRQNNILTNPKDIAEEIYIQQSILNQPAIPTCYHQPNYDEKCLCGVRQYP
jgi:exonuclease III